MLLLQLQTSAAAIPTATQRSKPIIGFRNHCEMN